MSSWSFICTQSADYFLHRMYSHIIYVAGVRHLLNVDACLFLGACDGSNDALLNDILQVRKSAPDITKVLKGVCPGTRVPVSATTQENQSSNEKSAKYV